MKDGDGDIPVLSSGHGLPPGRGSSSRRSVERKQNYDASRTLAWFHHSAREDKDGDENDDDEYRACVEAIDSNVADLRG